MVSVNFGSFLACFVLYIFATGVIFGSDFDIFFNSVI